MSFLDPGMEAELQRVLERFDCQAGTVHVLSGSQLFLRAAVGIPEMVLQMISVVPVGRGMTGLAVERKESVQLCDLHEDPLGIAGPAAKKTGMKGAIAVPLWREKNKRRELWGVWAVGKTRRYEFSGAEAAGLADEGEMLAGVKRCETAAAAGS